MLKLRKKTVVLGTAVLVLVGGGSALAYWTTSGSGSGSAANATANGTLTLSASFANGLTPGASESVAYTASNPGSSSLFVTTITPTVSVDATHAAAGCLGRRLHGDHGRVEHPGRGRRDERRRGQRNPGLRGHRREPGRVQGRHDHAQPRSATDDAVGAGHPPRPRDGVPARQQQRRNGEEAGMVRVGGVRRLAVVAAGVVSIAAAASAVQAATAADFTVAAAPDSQTVAIGGSTTFTMTVTPRHGFTGTVAAIRAGRPSRRHRRRGTRLADPGKGTAAASSTVTVAAGTTASPGTYTLTLTGRSGSVTGAAQVRLTIPVPPPPRALTLTAAPSEHGARAGEHRRVHRPHRPHRRHRCRRSRGHRPPGRRAGVVLTPARDGTTSVLSVRTTAATPEGRFALTVTGRSGTVLGTTTVTLVVEKPGVPFTIGGPLAPLTALAPGVTAPLKPGGHQPQRWRAQGHEPHREPGVHLGRGLSGRGELRADPVHRRLPADRARPDPPARCSSSASRARSGRG
jgi:hypothetical protein